MQRRDEIKLMIVCAAMLGLAFTLNEITKDERESRCLDVSAEVKATDADEPAEQEQAKYAEPAIVITMVEEQRKVEAEAVAAVILSAEDEEILMKMAMSEAECESTEGKALVMLVILNRVQSEEFPNTITDVVFQGIQFSPVSDGRYYSAIPNSDCKAALDLVESGWDESQGAMYFENYGADSWHSRNLEFLFQEGNHRFYK